MKRKIDIYDRALEFAVKTAKIVNNLPKNLVAKEYSKQLINQVLQ